jgi:hypothetical protein
MSTREPVLNFKDATLFGNDAGEDETIEVLASYFVDHPNFRDFFDQAQRFLVARSKKGMGKSALLSKLAYELSKQPSLLVLKLVGSDFTALGEFSSDDPSVIISQWQQAVCSRINLELGSRINVALSDTRMMMVEAAEISGYKGRNLIGSLLSRLKTKQLEVVSPAKGDQTQALRRFIAEDKTVQFSAVWLLVDDIDSTYQNTAKMKMKTSLFFSACRKLVQSVDGLFIRASVRTDVWPSLADNEDLDKCEQYMTDIHWTVEELGKILAKRISSYFQRTQEFSPYSNWSIDDQKEQLIELAFERRLKWGDTSVPALQVVNILAAKRPRWMAQLCRLAGQEAIRRNRAKIDMGCILGIMPKFGQLRLSDLYKEHQHQFSDVKRLTEAFSGGPRRYNTFELQHRILTQYIAKVGADKVPTLDGGETSALRLAHFLFKIGFVHARTDHSGSLSFLSFAERPTLLTSSVGLDNTMVWEVHPSYRGGLNIV